MLCSLVGVCWWLKGTCCLHFQYTWIVWLRKKESRYGDCRLRQGCVPRPVSGRVEVREQRNKERSYKWHAVPNYSFLSVRLLSHFHFSLLPALLFHICNFVVIYIYRCIYFGFHFCSSILLYFSHDFTCCFLHCPSVHPLRNSAFKVPFCIFVCIVFSKLNLHIYSDVRGNRFIWNFSMLLLYYMVTCTWSYCYKNWKSVLVPYLCDEIWLWYKMWACWVEKMTLWAYIYVAFNTLLCLTHRG